MPTPLRALTAAAVLLAVVAGCSPGPPVPGSTGPGGGLSGPTVTLTTGTCWTADLAGADPQDVLAISKKYGVTYFSAAHALAQRPSFDLTQACGGKHSVEVYKAVAMGQVAPAVTNFAALLRTSTPAYAKLSAGVERACMNQALLDGASQTGLPGAVMTPAFPDDVQLGWSPPSPEQWEKGQRVYACTLTQKDPGTLLYASVFSRSYPTEKRICIDNKTLAYVDCARKHDREVISVIDLSRAVSAGDFPGSKAIKRGPSGKYVDAAPSLLAALDRACTAYLRSMSSTKKLSGVAEIDADRWPATDGSYPVNCEADAPATKESVITEGSVFDQN